MATYQTQRYLLMTVDPVHIGTGGYRLGRVDNSIVREPGTRVPKIPGTSLHGAARSYAARLYENLLAAGKDHKEVPYPDVDPVCYTFGYVKKVGGEAETEEEKTRAYSGIVNVFDAQVLLFPVHSMCGPVWVSSPERMTEAGFSLENLPDSWDPGDGLFSWERPDPLNLGWLMLGVGGRVTVSAPEKWQGERWNTIKDRIVLVNEALFSQVVNSNLEVRTSVSIDPWRGAAEEGALFTYEALPRATFLVMETVIDDYRDSFPAKSRLEQWLQSALSEAERQRLQNQGWCIKGVQKTRGSTVLDQLGWSGPADVLQAGLQMLEWLGVGGMGTRGFGRLAIVGKPLNKTYPEETWQ